MQEREREKREKKREGERPLSQEKGESTLTCIARLSTVRSFVFYNNSSQRFFTFNTHT